MAAADATFGSLFAAPGARIVSAEALLKEMNGAGVDVAVGLGYGWTDRAAARLSNDYLIESAARSGGRIVPFCSVSPSWGEFALEEIERCAALGARGIGELHADTQGFQPQAAGQSAGLEAVLAAAERLDLIVLIHGSEPVGRAYPGKGTTTPERLLSLAQSFPGVRFVFGHWGGGLPFYALMPEVRRELANVWFDSAASPYLYRPEVFAAAAAAAGAERLLFGSDYPLLEQARALGDLRLAGLDKGAERAISGANAARLLGLMT